MQAEHHLAVGRAGDVEDQRDVRRTGVDVAERALDRVLVIEAGTARAFEDQVDGLGGQPAGECAIAPVAGPLLDGRCLA